ncbi:hypothetical protein PAPYR_11788 [Paratrimastix pyriformis]|uniref:Methyltransferase type 11 domain-containing protein n=1 Tax=Paratrimastix pyriformis TaxID=342808 RepID=A0ABQ8U8J4_9EUKA|nr:hypothetical protein PAPYR_11788 [Paratrimastix pyriformis]
MTNPCGTSLAGKTFSGFFLPVYSAYAVSSLNLRKLDFPSEIFQYRMDAILCGTDSYENLAQMNKELSRDLAPGGVFVSVSVRTTAPALPLLGWGGRFRGLGWAGLRVDAAGGPQPPPSVTPGWPCPAPPTVPGGRPAPDPRLLPAPGSLSAAASPAANPPPGPRTPWSSRLASGRPSRVGYVGMGTGCTGAWRARGAGAAMCRGPAAQLFLERLVSRLWEYNSNYDLTAPVDFLNWQLPIACGLRPAGDEVHTAAVVTPHLTLNLLGRRPCSM